MSKITFRADDELIDELESLDASKSEAMREALRSYLESARDTETESLDDLVGRRVDAIVEERLDGAFTPSSPQDINVNIALEGASVDRDGPDGSERKTETAEAEPDVQTGSDARKTCAQCGEDVGPEHVYCPNCGEKATHRVFCDCGDELRSDWAFCPSCGRRTPAADVLDGA
ncbi:double zinc ribbon domain-containing protein [Halococcus agarilyticus]|uniref:double zinc ribbon domain-containing protein n=1 Tax=Halococcus agarilyticus TaxID=1232219 RepID=UPI0006780CEE|nr:zinc ribbon domain-containing protein [Halococcus agarilyticus]